MSDGFQRIAECSDNRGSYQYSVKQFVTTSKSASEVILKQILMEKTVENSNTTEELPLQKTYDTANLALNMKQASIRTLLSYTEREEKDDHDLSEEECQPDWVTSSFRLGSIRRRKNEKNVAMQRIQKEIELEKQRHSDMIKMRQNDKRT
ncbi:Phosphoglucosamine mutase [Dirofilaria immitis]